MASTLETAQTPLKFRPPDNKGVTEINDESKKLFSASFQVPALRVPAAATNAFLKAGGEYLLNLPRYRSAVEDSAQHQGGDVAKGQHRIVLLRKDFPSDPALIPTRLRDLISQHAAALVEHTLTLDYSYWTSEDILRSILPAGLQPPGSFETAGHIAHLNLRDEYLPYKSLIGKVILDKNKQLRTVVNKLDSIDTEFRFFKLEILAGDDDTVAEVRESNSRFQLDLRRVYWNSRLQFEHERLVRLFHHGCVVCDVFAGVGPFAVPAAVNTSWGPAPPGMEADAPPPSRLVLANDLNPVSHEYLVRNVALNGVEGQVVPYNLDGREFVRLSLGELGSERVQNGIKEAVKRGRRRAREKDQALAARKRKRDTDDDGDAKGRRGRVGNSGTSNVSSDADAESVDIARYRWPHHYVMNLPATAVEFLDSFDGIYRPYISLLPPDVRSRVEDPENYDPPESAEGMPFPMPTIHVHCFSRSEDPEVDAIQLVEKHLRCQLQPGSVTAHRVRDVAPRKEMICVSFVLPVSVAFRCNILPSI